MSKEVRLDLIQKLQTQRNSKVITYVTSTRPGLNVPMAMDIIPIIYRHLCALNKNPDLAGHEKIDLFIHSNGGDGTVPWRLVTLIREHTKSFAVLVPHRAFSAATLTALGADEIVMHPMGVLGPTDPTVNSDYNPDDPSKPGQKKGINVEDVASYFALAREEASIHHDDGLIRAFEKLASEIHPLALGNVKRFLMQSRMMAKKLLSLHMNKTKQHDIDTIVDNLTSKLFFHGHPINRTEAVELGIETIAKKDEIVEGLMWQLYLEYDREMLMETPFVPLTELFANQPSLQVGLQVDNPPMTLKTAYIESVSETNVLESTYKMWGAVLPSPTLPPPSIPLVNMNVVALKSEWHVEP